MKYLEESGILLVRALLLGLEKIKLVSLRDVLDLKLEKIECWEMLSLDYCGVNGTNYGSELPWEME